MKTVLILCAVAVLASCQGQDEGEDYTTAGETANTSEDQPNPSAPYPFPPYPRYPAGKGEQQGVPASSGPYPTYPLPGLLPPPYYFPARPLYRPTPFLDSFHLPTTSLPDLPPSWTPSTSLLLPY